MAKTSRNFKHRCANPFMFSFPFEQYSNLKHPDQTMPMAGKRKRAASVYKVKDRGDYYGKKRKLGTTLQKRANYQARNYRVGGFIGQELNFYDTFRTTVNISSAGDATAAEYDPSAELCLYAPKQGAGASDRLGRKTLMKSIHMSGIIGVDDKDAQVALRSGALYFVALVLDTQTNGAQLNSEDVYTNPSGDVKSIACVLRDMERISRYKILATKRITTVQNLNTGVEGAETIDINGIQMPFEFFIPLNIPVEHIADGGTVADIQDNSIHLLIFCTNAEAAPYVSYNCRVRFVR